MESLRKLIVFRRYMYENQAEYVSRILFRKRELTEFCGNLGEFGEELGEFAFTHRK